MTRRRVLFREQAEADLLEVLEWVAGQSASLDAAAGFDAKLRAKCRSIAAVSATSGRPREDLAPGLRSVSWRNHIILLRYTPDAIEIVRVLHNRRDLAAALAPKPES